MSDCQSECIKIELPGVVFYVRHLDQDMHIRQTYPEKAPSLYTITKVKGKKAMGALGGTEEKNLPPGIDVRAPGLDIRLAYNEALLEIRCRDAAGIVHQCIFHGLARIDALPACPSARQRTNGFIIEECNDAPVHQRDIIANEPTRTPSNTDSSRTKSPRKSTASPGTHLASESTDNATGSQNSVPDANRKRKASQNRTECRHKRTSARSEHQRHHAISHMFS